MSDHSLEDGLGSDLLSELLCSDPSARSILCSGSGFIGDGEELDADCADAFVVKPISADYLKTTIRKVLGQKAT